MSSCLWYPPGEVTEITSRQQERRKRDWGRGGGGDAGSHPQTLPEVLCPPLVQVGKGVWGQRPIQARFGNMQSRPSPDLGRGGGKGRSTPKHTTCFLLGYSDRNECLLSHASTRGSVGAQNNAFPPSFWVPPADGQIDVSQVDGRRGPPRSGAHRQGCHEM